MASPPPSSLAQLARWAGVHRRAVIVGWLVVLVVAIAGGGALKGDYSADYSTPGSDSAAARDLLAKTFPDQAENGVQFVWTSPRGAAAPAVKARVDRLLAQAGGLTGIAGAPSTRQAEISPDGRVGIVRIGIDRRPDDVPKATGEKLVSLAQSAGGEVRAAVESRSVPGVQDDAQPSSEAIGIAAALVVLLLTLGTVIAAGLPLLAAVFGLGVSASVVGVLAALMDVPDWAPQLGAMIGLGVGIDYVLLIVARHRAAMADGLAPADAAVEAMATAGRSVLVAGSTVVVSMLGLFLMRLPYLYGAALAAMIAVVVVMAVAGTLVPALLVAAGPRLERWHVPGIRGAGVPKPYPTSTKSVRPPAYPSSTEGVRPFVYPTSTEGDSPRYGGAAEDRTPAARWARAVQRRPAAAIAAALAVLVVLAIPATGMRLGFPDAGNDRAGTTTREAYDMVARGFGPGANGPLTIVAQTPTARDRAALDRLAAVAKRDPGVAAVSPVRSDPTNNAGVVLVTPRGAPQDAKTGDLVKRLRAGAVAESGLVDVHVGGQTAQATDQSSTTARRLPLFIGGVVGLSLLLLLAAFRAPLVALKAGVMNLLSIGAAYGVVGLLAEGGWAGKLVGIDTDTPVPPFIPVIMFAVLFGLSMDYEVFLLSRVRERFDAHGDASRAVVEGVARTARVITAAAAIMVAVFAAFAFSDQVFLKLIGIGLAAAILVDATIVRMILVPAVMQLLGDRTWWRPAWLDRVLPRVDHEPAPSKVPA